MSDNTISIDLGLGLGLGGSTGTPAAATAAKINYYLAPSRHIKPLTFARATSGSAGYDLYANIPAMQCLAPRARLKVPTGLYLAMPVWCEAQVRGRSGLGSKGIDVHLATVDSDYRGEVHVILQNNGEAAWWMNPLDRVAQLVFSPVLPELAAIWAAPPTLTVEQVMDIRLLGTTARGTAGFGSTGQ